MLSAGRLEARRALMTCFWSGSESCAGQAARRCTPSFALTEPGTCRYSGGMQRSAQLDDAPVLSDDAATRRQDLVDAHEPRNLAVLALQQIVVRVGWIFKTESIVIPAFLDSIVGTPWLRDFLRGWLPMLNRLGQSVPPVLFSRRLKLMPQKKRALTACTLLMAMPFLILSGICFLTGGEGGGWLPWVFLLLYAAFFAVTGVSQLTMNTLQGKLIQPTRRGRLLMVSTGIGAPAAMVAAWLWMEDWLARPDGGFGYLFGFTGLTFLAASLCAWMLFEPEDDYCEAHSHPFRYFTDSWQIICLDANFRRLALVAACFSTVLMLFPHYQAMGREVLGLEMKTSLMLWVVVQNAGTFLFSVLAGPLADRRGNRLVLCGLILACTTTPLLAAALAFLGSELGGPAYWLVFVPLGLTPVVFRMLNNYTLELADPVDHPRYVSTLSLCLAVPIVCFSPLVGLLISMTSFQFVFFCGAAVILVGGILTARLAEPRHHRLPGDEGISSVVD